MTASRRRRQSLLRLLADHNPFYLLSAACMLLACVLLGNSTSYQPIGLGRLLGLIGALGVYELLLVALGLFLIVRRNLVRDGVMLLVVEAAFLADVGFLASEAYQHGLIVGLIVGGVLLAVGVAKLAVVFRGLRMPVGSAAFGVTVAVLAALLLHPAVLKNASAADAGRVSMTLMYGLWWLAAGLVAAYGLALRHRGAAFRGTRRPAAGIGHVIAGVLLASLVAHLGTAHWVYKSPFAAADLSPVLAALPVVFASLPATKFYRRRDAAVLCLLTLAVAVLTSVDPPHGLWLDVFGHRVEPIALASAAAYLSLIDCFAPAYFWRLAAFGLAAGAAYAVGPTVETLQRWAAVAYRAIADALAALMPSSQAAWGVLAGVGAFVMLAVGAFVSLARSKDDETSEDVPLVPSPGTPGEG